MPTALSKLLEETRVQKANRLPAKEIIAKIYSGYMDDQTSPQRQKRSFAPSGLFYGSGACAKRWYLSFHLGDYDSRVDPLQAAGLKNGIKSHERVQEAMLRSGVASEIEIKVVSSDPPIFGFADAKIEHDGIVYVGEYKSTKHNNYEYRVSTNKIADYHLGQLLIYMYILGIDNGIVIYESKDTNEMHGITFEMTPEYREAIEGVLDWCREVWQMYENKTMPKRSFRAGSKVCQSCPVQARCDEKDGTIKMRKLPFSP
jgi:hypothetical protein